jgi:hypothetical protein
MPPSFIQYVWDALSGRFRGRDGRFVSLANVRSSLDNALHAAGDDARDIAALYSSGTIGVAEFERQMQQLIKGTQIYASAVSTGGYANMAAAELTQLQQRLTEQFYYLRNWTDDLAAGVRITPGQLGARARMYALSARHTFDVTYRAGQVARGFDQELNTLNPGESCDGCRQQSALGWVSIGTLIPIGQRTCISNCNCLISYRKSA